MPTYFNDYEIAAKKIIAHVGKKIVLGVPIGIGKPIGLLNAFYRLALDDKEISLTILTGLTLARPIIHNQLEKKFLEPLLNRILGNYEDPLYEKARVLDQLPDNVHVIEFYLSPGKFLKNKSVQQNYVNSNYTNVVRDTLNYSINVIAQQVTYSKLFPNHYSLSCNTDLFQETVKELVKQEKPIAIVAEINLNLPLMVNDALVEANIFTDVIDTKRYRSLFSIPRPELSMQDHLIGLYSSSLIKDGSCLQIGIGKLGDAVTDAIIIRQKNNILYQSILKELSATKKFNVINEIGSLELFTEGLYASTEMLSEGYMNLINENILKKRVYDHIGLQKLLNEKKITENITPEILDILLENKLINHQLTVDDVGFLQKFGIFQSDINFANGFIILPTGEEFSANLTSVDSKNTLIKKCMGSVLKSGKIIHAGFFLGSNNFYQYLRGLSLEELQRIDMTSIARTNSLLWSDELLTLQRQNSRFINTTMMVTLTGSIISDGLKNWQEVSGVGGQFDFANMAQQLSLARFVINCHSTRTHQNKTYSNVLWDYPNLTLPRHLRDIIVTEYGIADCRSKTDAEIIQAILNITDSRFQNDLLKKAKKYGKLATDYEIPRQFQNNYPEALNPIIHELQRNGYGKPYPFGTDLTEEELMIKQALLFLKNLSKIKLTIIACISMIYFFNDKKFEKYLIRMQLLKPSTIRDYFYKNLLKFVINKQLNKC